MIIYYGTLKVKPGKKDEYIRELRRENLEGLFRKQPGNIFYSISASITDDNIIHVCDAWKDKASFDAHVSSDDCKVWFKLHDAYVEQDVRSDTFEAVSL